jgi:sugar transferase (PEP-CTERM/EpsH1 system associated)
VRVLIITEALPYPPDSGAPLRTYNLMLRVAREHQVWLATLLETPRQAEGLSRVRDMGVGVVTAVYQPRHPLAHLPGLFRYAVAGRPLELKFKYSRELMNKIRHLVSTVGFDIVQIEHSDRALYLEALPTDARCSRVLIFHNVVFQQWRRIFEVERRPVRKARAWLYSLMMRRWEPRYAGRFDRCIAVSDADRDLLREANPRLQIDVVPNGVDTQMCQPLPQKTTSPALLFVGMMNYRANSDAALYLCRQVLPHIRRMVGQVEVWIVGIDPPPEVRRLSGDGVHVTGRVEDVVPYYSRSGVCVVPLRAGGGTRLKILEAMALGRPVVSTSIGCEGLDVVDGEHLLVADSPEQFAERTVRLLTDDALYQRIIANARQLVVTRYDWDAIARRMLDIYSQLRQQNRSIGCSVTDAREGPICYRGAV